MAQQRTGVPRHTRRGVALTPAKILKEAVRLLQRDMRLLHSELAEKVGVIGLGMALTIGAVVFLIGGVILLFVAAIAALVDYGFSLTVATLLVSAALVVLGIACLWFGLRQFQVKRLMPSKTIQQVEEDLESIKREVIQS